MRRASVEYRFILTKWQILTNMVQRVVSSLANDAVHHLRDDHGHEVCGLARAEHFCALRKRPLLAQ